MNRSRRRFVRLTVTLLGSSALTSSLVGCGGSDTPPSGGGGGTGGGGTGGGGGATSACSTNGARDTGITGNHGHSLLVPAADFATGGDRTYDITGGADHPHSITLTQAQRNTILAGTAVTVPSTTNDAHLHSVTVACA